MLRDAASRRPVVAMPQVIVLDESDNPLDAFSSENGPADPPAPVLDSREAAACPEPTTVAAPRSGLDRPFHFPGLRLPRVVAPAVFSVLLLASLGLPAVSLLTASPGAVPLGGGAVTITSEPPGRTVRVDGVYRGVTPFATMLVSGAHRLEVGDGADIRGRDLQVRPGADVQLHISWTPAVGGLDAAAVVAKATRTDVVPASTSVKVEGGSAASTTAASVKADPSGTPARESARVPAPAPVSTGTLAVSSPFPVRVLLDGVEIGTDSTPKLSVPAGAHTVRLVNERLEFDQPVEITVAARRTHPLVVAPPQGVLHINAAPWAHVWIDGRRAGDTPIANLTLPIGEHDLLLRHPELGEERRTITVGARTPVRVGVELGR